MAGPPVVPVVDDALGAFLVATLRARRHNDALTLISLPAPWLPLEPLWDVLPALILAHQSATFPDLASVVLTGGYEPLRHPSARSRIPRIIRSVITQLITETGSTINRTQAA